MKSITVRTLQQRKQEQQPITMVTCYDATFARLVDGAGIDTILVGDSLGMVVQGQSNTLAVTVDEIAYHVRAVARGTQRAHIVGDMPFMSYHTSEADALRSAATLLQAGAHAVKLEGGKQVAATVRRMVDAGIPVMGHVGLLPQSVHAQGGFVVQGRDEASRQRIIEDAVALEDAGAYAVVLEGIPTDVAKAVTERLQIPTIGIGAGNVCDGQVLVLYDLLGLDPSFKPKFVKRFADGASLVTSALHDYISEVRSRSFPDADHAFGARPARVAALVNDVPVGNAAYGPTDETAADVVESQGETPATGKNPLRLASS